MPRFSFTADTKELVGTLSQTLPFVTSGGVTGSDRGRCVSVMVEPSDSDPTVGEVHFEALSYLGCARVKVQADDITLDGEQPEVFFSPSDIATLVGTTRTDKVKLSFDSSKDRSLTVSPVNENGDVLTVRSSSLSDINSDDASFSVTRYGDDANRDSVTISGIEFIEAISDAATAGTTKVKAQFLGVHVSAQEDSQYLLVTGCNGGSRIVQCECPLLEPAAADVAARVDPKIVASLADAVGSHAVRLGLGSQGELRLFVLDADGEILSEFFIESMTGDVDNDNRLITYPEAMISKKMAQIESLPIYELTLPAREFVASLAQAAKVAGTDPTWKDSKRIKLNYTPGSGVRIDVRCTASYTDTVTASSESITGEVEFMVKYDDLSQIFLSRLDRDGDATIPLAGTTDSTTDDVSPKFIMLNEGDGVYKAAIPVIAS